jgi:DNA-binding IclR family transcriptional regulator
VNLARVKALLEDSLSIREIADETGIPKSTVHRLKKQIDAAREGSHET